MAEKEPPLGRIDIFQTSPGFQTLDGVLRALTRKNKKDAAPRTGTETITAITPAAITQTDAERAITTGLKITTRHGTTAPTDVRSKGVHNQNNR